MAQDKFALSSAILGCLETGSATRADVIATIGTVTRSLSHLNFDPDLHDCKSQLEHPLAFIAFARSFLGYPPLIMGPHRFLEPGTEMELSARKLSNGKIILNDPYGGAAAGDSTISAIKHQNHDELARPYCEAAKSLGLFVSSNNPSTLGLVGSKFSSADLRSMLPQRPTAKSKRRMADVDKLLSDLRDDPSLDASRVFLEVRSILGASCPAPASGIHPTKGALLTVDRLITDEHTGQTALIDHTYIHATCATHSSHSFKFFESMFLKQADHPNLKSVLDKVCSKPVADRQAFKCAKYAPLVQLIDVLRSLGHVHGNLPQFFGPWALVLLIR